MNPPTSASSKIKAHTFIDQVCLLVHMHQTWRISKRKQVSFVFLYIYQMESYSKGAAMRGSKRKYFIHLWWEYDIWGIPQGCLDNRCLLNKNEKPMLPPPLWLQSGRRGRWSFLLSEKGLQRSHIILTGEGPGPIHALWGRTADIWRHFSDLGMSWFES